MSQDELDDLMKNALFARHELDKLTGGSEVKLGAYRDALERAFEALKSTVWINPEAGEKALLAVPSGPEVLAAIADHRALLARRSRVESEIQAMKG